MRCWAIGRGLADYPRLKYIELVVQERCAKHPASGFSSDGRPIESVELGGYTIPKGAWIMIRARCPKRRPQFSQSPDFDPERFAPAGSSRFRRMPTFPSEAARESAGPTAWPPRDDAAGGHSSRRFRLVMLPGHRSNRRSKSCRPKGALCLRGARHAAMRKVANSTAHLAMLSFPRSASETPVATLRVAILPVTGYDSASGTHTPTRSVPTRIPRRAWEREARCAVELSLEKGHRLRLVCLPMCPSLSLDCRTGGRRR